MNTPSRTCGVYVLCHKAVAKYVCPSCKIAYCSIDCYTVTNEAIKHDLNCTESFYSKQVYEELSLRQKEDKSKNEAAIAQMLKRAQESIVEPLDLSYNTNAEEWMDPDEEDAFLEDLSQKLENGETIDLRTLPKSIQRAFFRDVANGKCDQTVTPWTPWWMMPERTHKETIQRIVKPLVIEEENHSSCSFPCLLVYLKNHLYKDVRLPVSVSSSIPYNVAEVLYVYCLCMRMYNGDVDCSKEDIVTDACTLSMVLSRNAVYSSMSEFVASVLSNERIIKFVGETLHETQTQTSSGLQFNHKQNGSVIHHTFSDVLLLLETSHYAIDALAHLYVLCKSIVSTTEKPFQKQPIVHKLAFLITYMRRLEAEQFWLLHKELKVVLATYDTDWVKDEKNDGSGKPRIEVM